MAENTASAHGDSGARAGVHPPARAATAPSVSSPWSHSQDDPTRARPSPREPPVRVPGAPAPVPAAAQVPVSRLHLLSPALAHTSVPQPISSEGMRGSSPLQDRANWQGRLKNEARAQLLRTRGCRRSLLAPSDKRAALVWCWRQRSTPLKRTDSKHRLFPSAHQASSSRSPGVNPSEEVELFTSEFPEHAQTSGCRCPPGRSIEMQLFVSDN